MDRNNLIIELYGDKNIYEAEKDKYEKNEKLLLDNEEYKITAIEGLESSDFEVEIEGNMNFDGGILKSKKVSSRTITLSAEYIGENVLEERKRLISLFNPSKTGILIAYFNGSDKKAIEYEIESIKINLENIYNPISFTVTLMCPDPYFKDVVMQTQVGAVWIDGLKFGFKLPFHLRKRETSVNGNVIKIIENKGHVDCPIQVEFHGPAENPRVENITTKEFIKINKTLKDGEILYISTEYGNKKVKIKGEDGNIKNAFNYIDLDSTFFSLVPGKNSISYSNSNDKLTGQSVKISFKNKYLGI